VPSTARRRSLDHRVTIFATAAALLAPPAAAQVLPDTLAPITFAPSDTPRCLKCHGMANFVVQDPVSRTVHDYSVNADAFRGSVHARVECQSCHPDVRQYPHALTAPRAPVSCAADCHASDSLGRVYSHDSVVTAFGQSIHRAGLLEGPVDQPRCVTCHGGGNPHAIARPDSAFSPPARITLCITCHDNAELMTRHGVDTEAVSSYRRSFHYKAIRFGDSTTAACQDCHTAHHVLPADSAGSSIAPDRIAGTCGQQGCHAGAEMNFAMSGANHLSMRIAREPVLWWIEKFFIVLTAGTMLMLLVGIVLDIQRTFGWGRLAAGLTGRLAGAGRRLASGLPAAGRLARRLLVD
jgi:hypothetical protein